MKISRRFFIGTLQPSSSRITRAGISRSEEGTRTRVRRLSRTPLATLPDSLRALRASPSTSPVPHTRFAKPGLCLYLCCARNQSRDQTDRPGRQQRWVALAALSAHPSRPLRPAMSHKRSVPHPRCSTPVLCLHLLLLNQRSDTPPRSHRPPTTVGRLSRTHLATLTDRLLAVRLSPSTSPLPELFPLPAEPQNSPTALASTDVSERCTRHQRGRPSCLGVRRSPECQDGLRRILQVH